MNLYFNGNKIEEQQENNHSKDCLLLKRNLITERQNYLLEKN